MRHFFALIAAAAAASASPSVAVQPATAPAPAEANDARQILKELVAVDSNRLFEDKAYAEQTLARIDALRKSGNPSDDVRQIMDRVRVLALIGLDRLQEAFDQATDLTKANPGDSGLHYTAFALGVDTGSERTLDVLELADRSIANKQDRANFRDSLETDTVGYFRRPFFIAKDKERIARSARALMNFGWPGPHKLATADGLRLDIADYLLEKGDVAGAKKLVFAIRTAEPLLQTLIARKWDAVRDSGDPNERLAQSIAASDEASRAALFDKPDDLEIVIRRGQFLRSVGKDAEALDLLLPKTADLQWMKQQGEYAYWIANEAAYALVDLKREKEAVALMEKLLSLGLEENPVLVSMAINSVAIRIDAGDFRGAADYAEMLATKHGNIASPYGRMWMWEGAACGNFLAGSLDRAQPWLVKLKSNEKDNRAALTRALLCVNDIDGAAASVIRRLDGDDAEQMLAAVQDYSGGPEFSPAKKILESRLRQVIARPDVQAAIAKHGRVMKVPLSRTYWGMF